MPPELALPEAIWQPRGVLQTRGRGGAGKGSLIAENQSVKSVPQEGEN